jgi:prepilin-type N-terminal cleavage/methylation domain-containing protein
MRARSGRPSGFTLIELMIVVAIIGILASVAIPGYGLFTLRAKSAERRVMTTHLKALVEDIYVRDGQLPKAFVNAGPNPTGAPGTTKKAFTLNYMDWPLILTNDAAPSQLYFQYWVMAFNAGASDFLYIQASSDLDGDGVQSVSWSWFQRTGGYYTTNPGWNVEDTANF